MIKVGDLVQVIAAPPGRKTNLVGHIGRVFHTTGRPHTNYHALDNLPIKRTQLGEIRGFREDCLRKISLDDQPASLSFHELLSKLKEDKRCNSTET